LDHAHFGVEVVDHADEHGLGRGGVDGGAPLGLALVAEDDVFEAFEAVGVEFVFHPGFTRELVAEDDVALEDAFAGAFGRERAFVLDDFAGVVEEDAGEGEVGVDFGI